MMQRKNYDINQLRDYSSLFSRSEVSRWYKNDFSSLRLKIHRYDPLQLQKKNTYLTYLKKVYGILEQFYPNQYVYKNEFIKQWLLQQIGLKDSVVFSELRLGKAVADLTMFNGVSRVFEIKTLLDTENRLDNQLAQYEKLFNEIFLVVPTSKADFYLKRDSFTGIITYDHVSRTFVKLRPAKYLVNIDADCLMGVLHTREYLRIAEEYFGELPPLNDFNKFQVCKELINQIPSVILNQQFISVMKERKIYNEFSLQNAQFNQICLAMNYSLDQRRQLLSNLSTTIL